MISRNSFKGSTANQPKPQESQTRRFRLVRYFTLTSFGLLVPVALALTYFLVQQGNFLLQHSQEDREYFKKVQEGLSKQQDDAARRDLLAIHEAGTVNLAHLLENALWEKDFAPFVASAQKIPVEACRAMADVKDEKNGEMKPPREKQACFSELGKKFMRIPGFTDLNAKVYAAMRQSTVFKIKVFDLRGITLYSSEHSQIGQDKASNAGWIMAAGEGKPASELTYRDKFSAFEGVVEKRDLISIYLPVLQPGSKQIVGVFEVYSDVTHLLEQIKKTSADIKKSSAASLAMAEQANDAMRAEMERWGNQTLVIVLTLMLVLFGALFMIVRRADGIITRQENEGEKAGEALRASEMQFRQITEGMAEGVITTTTEDIVVEANKALLQLFGYEKSELIGRDVSELVPERHRRQYKDTTAALAAQPEAFNIHDQEVRSLRKDGSEFLASISFSDVQVGGRRLFTALVVDITERKRAAAELLRFKNVLDNTLDMIFMFEPESLRFVYVNQGAVLSMGYSREELLGMTPYQIKPLMPEPKFRQLIAPQIEGEQSVLHFETLHRRKDGTDFPVDIFLQLVKESNGRSLFVAIVRDVTENRRAQDEILRAKVAVAVADDANAAKSAFLANMSHEIRTPMNSIIGMAHLALKTELSPKQSDYIAKIQLSSQHLLAIINDILDFSKIEAKQLVLETLDLYLPSVFWDIASQLLDNASAKGLKLVFDIDPQLSQPLQGDPLRLRQILLNYISNAIKFTHQGKITVRVSLLEETASDCLVRFEVQDSGIGMSEAEMAHLFQAFHQADTSTTRYYGGTGLGLAISKQLAELMGGEVGLESQPGHGSTFWFTVRLARSTDKPVSVQEAPPPVDLSLIKGAAVLLVEDNLFNQQVTRELLEQAGAAVTIANNGQEALDWLLKDRFDCVLMDVQMPVMDGLAASRQIRANPALSSTPVIGLTANARQEDQARCFEAGMNDFVSKPYEPDRLLAVLAAWLTQQLGQSQPAHAASTVAAQPLTLAAINDAAAGDDSVIDLAVLAKTVGHNPEKIRKYALMFVSSMHDTLAEVEAMLASADMMRVAALGHREKSSARAVGAMGFADLCQALEQCKRPVDYDKGCGIVAQMRPLVARISKQIDKELNEQRSSDCQVLSD